MSRTIEEMEEIAHLLASEVGNAKLELRHLQRKYDELLEFADAMHLGLVTTGYGAGTTDAYNRWRITNEQT